MTKSKGLMKTPRGTRAAWVEQEQGKHLCACGCGGAISIRPEHYPRPPQYIHSHNRRGQRAPRPAPEPCACRCGLLAPPGKNYISGHNSRVRQHTDETKERMRISKLGDRNPQFGNRSIRPRLPCVCGCGELAKPGREFVSGHNSRGSRMSTYRGWFIEAGYIWIEAAYHPFARDGYVREHRLVVERFLSDTEPGSPCLIRLGDHLYLDPELVVHHRDGNKTNNLIENLAVMTRDEHTALHHEQGDLHR